MASYLITSQQIEGEKVETEELMLLNCGPGGDTWESLGQQEDQPVNPKGNQPWIFIGRTDAELKLQYSGHLMQEPTHWRRPCCWERLKAKGKRGGRG